LEEHSDWILALIAKQPDLTIEETLAAMAKQGIPVMSIATLEVTQFPRDRTNPGSCFQTRNCSAITNMNPLCAPIGNNRRR
jgi:hypothetical protein